MTTMDSPDTEFISILGAANNPGTAARVSSRSLPDTLAVLGLSDIVIFPNMVAPLLVETPGSIQLIDDAVGGDRLLGAVIGASGHVHVRRGAADAGVPDVAHRGRRPRRGRQDATRPRR